MVAAAVPLAILANALRVAITAAHPSIAAGLPHMVLGWVLFVFCLAGLGNVHWLLAKLGGGAGA